MIFIKTTIDDEKLSSKIAETLLNKKLAGCVQFIPIKSTYIWKGNIERSLEILMLIKTTDKAKKKVIKVIKEMHPYDVPEISEIEAEANSEYIKWLEDVVSIK